VAFYVFVSALRCECLGMGETGRKTRERMGREGLAPNRLYEVAPTFIIPRMVCTESALFLYFLFFAGDRKQKLGLGGIGWRLPLRAFFFPEWREAFDHWRFGRSTGGPSICLVDRYLSAGRVGV